jgi:crotonobetainyl-CoA:carnitine CoA-transferase CaiB-like acyl-CoA transferase
MMQIMGPLISAWHTEGYLQPRLGSGIAYSVPRGTYQASDGGWIAVSTSSDALAQRVMELIGVGDDERFQTFDGRIANREEVDRLMAEWVRQRTLSEALESFEAAQAAAAPVLNVGELSSDRHVAERGSLVEVDGVVMQSLIAQLSKTPGRVRWAGRSLGADNEMMPGPDALWFED